MLSNMAYSNMVANANLSMQNAVSNQQAMNELNVSVTAAASNIVKNIGPLEARSAVDVLTNNELAAEISGLKATLAAFPSASPSGGGGGKKPTPLHPAGQGSLNNLYPPDSTIYAKLPTDFVTMNVDKPENVEISSRTEKGGNAVLTLKATKP